MFATQNGRSNPVRISSNRCEKLNASPWLRPAPVEFVSQLKRRYCSGCSRAGFEQCMHWLEPRPAKIFEARPGLCGRGDCNGSNAAAPPIFASPSRVLKSQVWRPARLPPVHDADSDDESFAQDASPARSATGIRSDSDPGTHRSSGAGARGFHLRHGPAYLRLGPLVRFAHSSADDVWPRILWARGKSRLRSYLREAGRFRQRGNARELRALPAVPHGPAARLPERENYRN